MRNPGQSTASHNTDAKLARWAKEAGEKALHLHRLNIGPRLTLCFVLIILAMLVGNAVLLWQFQLARVQAQRLSSFDQELVTVLQVHTSLMALYERLDVLTQSEDTVRLMKEVETSRDVLLDQRQRSRDVLRRLSTEMQLDPTLLPTVEAVQGALPEQLEAITALAKARDWEGVRLRLIKEVRPLESRTSMLVQNVDREVGEQRARALLNIEQAQRRMFFIVPITALLTLLIAALLGLAIRRSITHPLGQLMEGSKALARGEFQHRVSVIGQDELAHLGQAFNNAAGRLQDLYATLRQNERELRQLIDVIPQHIIVLEPDGCSLYVNHVAVEYTGLTLEAILAKDSPAKIFHPDDLERVLSECQDAISDGVPWEAEGRIRGKDGEYRWFLTRISPLRDEQGRILRWYGTRTDIEDRKQAEDALRRSEAYLAEAQRLTHTGSWAVTMREILYWSPETFRIFGLNPAKGKPSLEEFVKRTHPDDRARFDKVIEGAVSGKRDFEIDWRLVLPDGTEKHVHTVGHPVVNEAGDVVELVGSIVDVTEQHEARAALEKAFQEIQALKDQLYNENIALREEIDKASMFEEIVGVSPMLQAVLARVSKVASTDSTVLIFGETGTGKELVARAIHKRSPRSSRAFVSVNCAAIPQGLIASELFGHEKGAFTGALQRRLGRFELAEGGTIFLDEIGELPAETQVALLRVLQEREFERVGGNHTIQTDVRVIAATSRDLNAAIVGGAFRSDLFYRLNVFPLEMPPLRERREDIPLLVGYFIDRYASKAGKKIRSVHNKTLELFQSYPWPGNVRELQNIIERSVILCETENLSVDQSWFSQAILTAPPSRPLSDQTDEKQIIEAALAQTRGRVSGPSGAAFMLGMPASTLESKIRSLKIDKYQFKT